MKFPVRPAAVFASGLIMLAACASALAAKAPSPANPEAAGAADQNSTGSLGPGQAIDVPGPLHSFLRMTGISQEITPADVLPLLARNAFLYGHVGDKRTEYLVLADRYVQQARELRPLAGGDGVIRVTGCNDVGPLIQILGYKFENGCSAKDASLITENAERAFLTVDSGFPITRLEQSLQQGVPFTFEFPATRVPILFNESDWTQLLPTKERNGSTVLDLLMNNEDADRLYSALVAARSADEARPVPGTRVQETALLRPGAGLLWKPVVHS